MPPASRVLAFLLTFLAFFLFALALVIVSEFTDIQWVERIVRIGEGLERLTLVAIATAFMLVEGVPMLAAWIRRELIKEAEERGKTEGKIEGRTLERDAWQTWLRNSDAWEQRKAEAEREGKDFTEPRPAPPDGD